MTFHDVRRQVLADQQEAARLRGGISPDERVTERAHFTRSEVLRTAKGTRRIVTTEFGCAK